LLKSVTVFESHHTNAVIFYNANILSELLKKKEVTGMAETDFIKAISPVAWRHIPYLPFCGVGQKYRVCQASNF
jgi:hypothetical protein